MDENPHRKSVAGCPTTLAGRLGPSLRESQDDARRRRASGSLPVAQLEAGKSWFAVRSTNSLALHAALPQRLGSFGRQSQELPWHDGPSQTPEPTLGSSKGDHRDCSKFACSARCLFVGSIGGHGG